MPVARIFHILRGKRYIFCGRLLTCVFRGLCALILLSFLNECLFFQVVFICMVVQCLVPYLNTNLNTQTKVKSWKQAIKEILATEGTTCHSNNTYCVPSYGNDIEKNTFFRKGSVLKSPKSQFCLASGLAGFKPINLHTLAKLLAGKIPGKKVPESHIIIVFFGWKTFSWPNPRERITKRLMPDIQRRKEVVQYPAN